MSKFYRTDHFRALQREWRKHLAESKFDDIEDEKENLRSHDRRTQAFDNREAIADFFRALDHYLTEHPEVPTGHRSILELYSRGLHQIDIAKRLAISRRTVYTVVYSYSQLIVTN